MTDYDRIGGEAALRSLIGAFVQRMAGDFVVGYHFAGKDLERIAYHEVEHASAHLGGPTGYTGRSLASAHEPLRIHRGHFRRRLAVLRKVLEEHHVPPEVIDRWIAHDAALEPVVADPTDCAPRG